MSGRILVAGLILSMSVGVVWSQDRFDPEMVRSTLDRQFSELDADDDEQLDENEINGIPGPTLVMFRAHGLGDSFPISRTAFLTAGVATAAAQAGETEPAKPSNPEENLPKPVVTRTETPPITSPARNGTRKNRYVLDLPPEYAARDKNGDGQIGLYEWDRKKYAEFVKLDKNGDGFLTPAELVSKEMLKAAYSRTTPPSSTPSATTPSSPTPPGSPMSPPGSPIAGPPGTPGGADSVESEARGAFARLDDNKDGEVVETEWMNHRSTRQMFESAGTKISLPIKVDAFISVYRTARSAAKSS